MATIEPHSKTGIGSALWDRLLFSPIPNMLKQMAVNKGLNTFYMIFSVTDVQLPLWKVMKNKDLEKGLMSDLLRNIQYFTYTPPAIPHPCFLCPPPDVAWKHLCSRWNSDPLVNNITGGTSLMDNWPAARPTNRLGPSLLALCSTLPGALATPWQGKCIKD